LMYAKEHAPCTGMHVVKENWMREHSTYLIFDRISFRMRTFFSVLLVAIGFLVQLTTTNILAGLPFIVFCSVFNLLRGISIKKIVPKKLTWQEVTPNKIDDVIVQCDQIKRFRSSNVGCIVVVVLFIFGLSFGAPLVFSLLSSVPFALTATVVNALILFAVLGVGGRKSAWMPYALDIKAQIVQRMLSSPLLKAEPGTMAVPYIEIGEGDDGTFPNDVRFLVKFKDAPDDLIGLQGQISINTVKGRPYPYFYVVIIAKHAFKLFEKCRREELDKLVIEHKQTDEVDVVVIRQRTTKTSGYHTDDRIQDHILRQGIVLTRKIIEIK